MTADAMRSRVASIVETDWKRKAEALLAERLESGAGKVYIYFRVSQCSHFC